MRYRRLGRTELQVSAVSLGGAYLGGKEEPERAEETLKRLCGARWIWAAITSIQHRSTGRAKSCWARRWPGAPPFYLATKVGFRPEDFDYRRDSVLQSLERSLALLGLTKLTVAQIHEVNMAGWERIVEKGGTLEGLRAAQKQGLCDFIGVTGRPSPCWRGWRRLANLIRCCATTTTIPVCS